MSSTNPAELALHEERAQHGIIEFAEEMQFIRDSNLYPGAKQEPDAWPDYCKNRWGQSKSTVDKIIRAAPVLKRRAVMGNDVPRVMVSSATEVATLPEEVQDEILDTTEKRDDVKAKAQAVRKAQKRIREQEGREPEPEELVEVAKAAKPKKAKTKKDKKRSKFTAAMEQAYYFIEQAADIAQGDTLTDVENDYAWNRTRKIDYQNDRIKERLYQPEIERDADEEFAELLGGSDES